MRALIFNLILFDHKTSFIIPYSNKRNYKLLRDEFLCINDQYRSHNL